MSEAERNPQLFSIIYNVADIVAAKRANLVRLMLGFQGTDVLGAPPAGRAAAAKGGWWGFS
jgi:hypothetical protein